MSNFLGPAPSSAYVPIKYLYEVDIEKEEVTLIKHESEEPIINYDLLAMEEADLFFEHDTRQYEADFENMNTEKEVIEYARRKVRELNPFEWLYPMEDVEIPIDFKDKFFFKFRKEFIDNMVQCWESYREMLEWDEIA